MLRRLYPTTFSLLFFGFIAVIFFQSSAYAVDIQANSELEVRVNKNSYTFDNSGSGGVIYVKHDLFDEVALLDAGDGQYFHQGYPFGNLTVKCSDQASADLSIGATTVSQGKNLRDQLESGETPDINLTITIIGLADEKDKGACPRKFGKIYSEGPQSVKTQERQKAANTILKQSVITNTEKAYGDALLPGMKGLLDVFKYDTLDKDSRISAGCSNFGGGLSCDIKQRETLLKQTLGRCWQRAETVVSNKTFGDTSEKATKDIYYACIKEFFPTDGQTESKIQHAISSISRGDMRKKAEEAKANTEKDLNSPTGGVKEPEEEPSCSNQGLVAAWILCPALDGAVRLADWSWSVFEFMLAHNPIQRYEIDKTTNKPTNRETAYYLTWSKVRNTANVALVILFLFVIYSQITGYGISNYGIKQSLPRIIVIAILINLSFLLLQITFDIASIAGKTVDDMIAGHITTLPTLDALVTDIIAAGTFTLVGVGGAAAAIAVAGAPTALLFVTLLILPGVIALIAGFFTVLMRNALLPVMAVFAPLALVAYVLPNTSGIFEKWKKTFTSLLFLYPVASLYYAALKAAAIIMIGNQSPDSTLQRLMGFAMLLFGSGFIAILAVKSNAITGKIMGGAQGILNRMASPIEKIGRDTMSAMALDKMGAFRSQDFGNKSRWNPKRYIGKSMQSFDRRARDRKLRTALRSSEADQQYNQGVLADTSRLGGLDKTIGGQAYINKLQSDAVANKEISLRNEDINSLGRILENAIKSGDAVSARAAQKSLLGSGAPGIQKLQNTLSAVENSGIGQDNSIMSSLRQDINSAGIKGKDAVLATWGYQNGKTIDQVRSDANTYSGLNAIEAAGQSVENLTAGVASGGITADIVKRIDSSDAAQSILTGKKSGILEPLREK